MAMSRSKLVLLDAMRIAASVWSGVALTISSRGSAPAVIYERVAVMQSLSSFHSSKNRAFRIVESNGLMARESAADRNALALVGLAEAIERHVYRSADMVVVVSESLAREVEKFAGITRDKIVVCPNAISPGVANASLVESEETIIGFVGSVVKWQRIDRLLQSMADLAAQEPDVYDGSILEIVGDGPELGDLKNQAAELGIGAHVRFRGRVQHHEVLKLMASWTAAYSGHEATSSSGMYHSPLKLYEYAGLGLAVAATQSDDALCLNDSGADIRFFSDADDLNAVLLALLAEGRSIRATRENRRSAVLRDHSWDQRAKEVLQLATTGSLV
jgi:glycosyltransferase involved in cell wall biosynthesis